MTDDISDLFREVAANMTAVAGGAYPQAVRKAVDLVSEAFASGQKLLVFGNGAIRRCEAFKLNSSGG